MGKRNSIKWEFSWLDYSVQALQLNTLLGILIITRLAYLLFKVNWFIFDQHWKWLNFDKYKFNLGLLLTKPVLLNLVVRYICRHKSEKYWIMNTKFITLSLRLMIVRTIWNKVINRLQVQNLIPPPLLGCILAWTGYTGHCGEGKTVMSDIFLWTQVLAN